MQFNDRHSISSFVAQFTLIDTTGCGDVEISTGIQCINCVFASAVIEVDTYLKVDCAMLWQHPYREGVRSAPIDQNSISREVGLSLFV